MAQNDDTLQSKHEAQAAGTNPRAIAKVVTRIIPRAPLEEVVPEEEKSSTPMPAGVSPTNKGLVRAGSAPLSSGLTLEKLTEYEKMGIPVEPVSMADVVDELAEDHEDEQLNAGANRFSPEERAALLDEELSGQVSVATGKAKNKAKLRAKGQPKDKTSDATGKIEPVLEGKTEDAMVDQGSVDMKPEQAEAPKSLLNMKKPAYQSDLQFAQELSMADPKIVSSLVKEWIKGEKA